MNWRYSRIGFMYCAWLVKARGLSRWLIQPGRRPGIIHHSSLILRHSLSNILLMFDIFFIFNHQNQTNYDQISGIAQRRLRNSRF